MTETVKSKGGFDWLATFIYPLSVVLMEVFWVYPWLLWLGYLPAFSMGRPVLSLASVVFTLGASLVLTRIAIRREWGLWRMRVVIIGTGLFVILFVLGVDYRGGYDFLSGEWFRYIGQTLAHTLDRPNSVVLALPALLYLWWRGINLGQATLYFKDIYRNFVPGMAALIVLIILWQISSTSERFVKPASDIGWYVMAFFFFGLTSIAICHVYLMRSSMAKEESSRTSAWRWMPITLGVIAVMVLVGFGLASIFSPELYESIGKGFNAIGSFLGTILSYILMPVIYVAAWVMRFIKFILSLLTGEPTEQPPAENGGMPEFGDVTPKDWPLWLTDAIKWFVIALIVAAVIFILVKAVSRMRSRRPREEIEEIHESLFSWKGLRDDLRELLGMMGNRFRRKPAAPGIAFDGNARGRMDIREIYRHVIWEGGRSGVPRRRAETASEYSGRLRRFVPESDELLTGITGEYENVRYGEIREPEEKVDKANSWWEKLRSLIRKLREE